MLDDEESVTRSLDMPAIGRPMMPVPMKPTLCDMALSRPAVRPPWTILRQEPMALLTSWDHSSEQGWRTGQRRSPVTS